MFDGVEGSFALSTEHVDQKTAMDWTWSSQLNVHVELEDTSVFAHQVSQRSSPLRFELDQVESNLERFLDTLVSRKIDPPTSIVDHVVQCFRSHRRVAADSGLDANDSLTTFLALIDNIIDKERVVSDKRLPPEHGERLREELSYNRLMQRRADLSLTMRHAAGMVFQETHAELSAEPLQPQLFGLAPAPSRSTRNRLGAYYTPPGLARVLSDVAVAPHIDQSKLRIVDPACGSGIFLSEILRSLQRHGFSGSLELVGFDVSLGAIEMARFALKHNDASRSAKIRLEPVDFLCLESPLEADIIIMNPPFVSAPDLEPALRERARQILGGAFKNRPDLSMVFTSLGLSHLKEGGTLATLLPSGVLSQRGGATWRSKIVEASDLELLAVLGDHGLFRDAIVNIAALVLRKTIEDKRIKPVMLWASQKRGASSAALRRLRRWYDGDDKPDRTIDWSIHRASRRTILNNDDWTPRPHSLGALPDLLRLTDHVVSVDQLFRVELGIRAGKNKSSLQISTASYQRLPKRERSFFRPVAETRSIRNGRIQPVSWLFYPESPMTADEILRVAPTFFNQHLSSIGFSKDAHIDLERARRDTNLSFAPRIVSRAFLSTNSFAVDANGSHVVVQGYSWLPRSSLRDSAFEIVDLLADYCLILNSRIFFMLLRETCRIVGGGQVDGAKNQVKGISLPDLPALYLQSPEMKVLADKLRRLDEVEQPSLQELDEFTAATYRTRREDWFFSE